MYEIQVTNAVEQPCFDCMSTSSIGTSLLQKSVPWTFAPVVCSSFLGGPSNCTPLPNVNVDADCGLRGKTIDYLQLKYAELMSATCNVFDRIREEIHWLGLNIYSLTYKISLQSEESPDYSANFHMDTMGDLQWFSDKAGVHYVVTQPGIRISAEASHSMFKFTFRVTIVMAAKAIFSATGNFRPGSRCRFRFGTNRHMR
ncbi:hypothetical protein EG68_11513 [Paragonimus skrjabini miyazakii]|uniref:Uncharacterized protein n=1 Tax=Paragonimus skrjabini miyazakii TaxID=59628 RepID=A0A8S9YBF7_9TREM|nr:hypothetical protein EG68_11513 [Paragonimus skrjabini miyazakii]